jgi:hypothetical protein
VSPKRLARSPLILVVVLFVVSPVARAADMTKTLRVVLLHRRERLRSAGRLRLVLVLRDRRHLRSALRLRLLRASGADGPEHGRGVAGSHRPGAHVHDQGAPGIRFAQIRRSRASRASSSPRTTSTA